jgi:hypothetical protein
MSNHDPFELPKKEAAPVAAVPLPTPQQAEQFCLMINAGMPSLDAIRYFLGEGDWTPGAIELVHNKWLGSRAVQQAWTVIMGSEWQNLDLDRRIQFSMDKHYSELAYYVYSHNFSTVAGSDITKLNTARAVLEAKLAGTAGKLDAMSQWLDDLRLGRVKLGVPSPTLPSGSGREAPTPTKGGGALQPN